MITKKQLNHAIKNEKYLWIKASKGKMLPIKIGRWNGVDCVLLEYNQQDRVIDLQYVLKNFEIKCLYF